MRLVALVAGALFGAPVSAQWLHQPTAGIPRLANGKPNLAAPAPRTSSGKPDLSGQWSLPLHPGYIANVAADLAPSDVRPWAAELFEQRAYGLGKDDPGTIGCQPLGTRHVTGGVPTSRVKIVQTPTVIVFLYEDLAYRQIFLDGRELPRDPFPTFMGYSVGHWDGDELVVESIGFNEQTWLDFGGHPHTESLRITERYRRADLGHMHRSVVLDDPKTFAKPIALDADMTLEADTELLEAVCTETPREQFDLTAPAEAAVRVAPEVLAKYVGAYELPAPASFGIRVFTVSLVDGKLYIDFNGKGRVPFVPLSQTTFSPRLLGTYEFVADAQGNVDRMLVHAVEATWVAVRRAGR
jgi:hypothetical protein